MTIHKCECGVNYYTKHDDLGLCDTCQEEAMTMMKDAMTFIKQELQKSGITVRPIAIVTEVLEA